MNKIPHPLPRRVFDEWQQYQVVALFIFKLIAGHYGLHTDDAPYCAKSVARLVYETPSKLAVIKRAKELSKEYADKDIQVRIFVQDCGIGHDGEYIVSPSYGNYNRTKHAEFFWLYPGYTYYGKYDPKACRNR